MEPIKSIETTWRIFRIHNIAGSIPDQQYANLEIVNRETYASYKEAEAWVLDNGDYKVLDHSFIIWPCIRVATEYK